MISKTVQNVCEFIRTESKGFDIPCFQEDKLIHSLHKTSSTVLDSISILTEFQSSK